MNEFYNKLKYFEETEKVRSEIYYHYTSLEALYSIVTSKTFRLTSLKSSNDKKELFYKPEHFLSDFKNIIEKEGDDSTKKILLLIQQSVNNNYNSFINECKEKTQHFALCLSKKKDNLTHWDRYAVNCTGVCIAFNVASLKVLAQRTNTTALTVGLYDVSSVSYTQQETDKRIRNCIVRILNLLFEEWQPKNIEKFILENGYVYAAVACRLAMKFTKNSSFVDEDEIRFYHDSASIKSMLNLLKTMKLDIPPELHTNLRKNFQNLVTDLKIREEKYCLTTAGIREYRNLCLEEIWGSGVVPEIVLGPMCIQNRTELRRFLNANGLQGTKISISEVPIR